MNKKIVLTYGLISGAIMSAMFLLTLPFHDRLSPETGMLIGYTSMVAASVLVYFGVRRYRDTVAGGSIGFGRAAGVGALIALVANLVYVAMWQVVFFTFMPDYLEKYQARMRERERAAGATAAQLEARRIEDAKFAELYRNPAVNAAFTFLEPLPVSVLAVLVSAALLRRRRAGAMPAGVAGVAG